MFLNSIFLKTSSKESCFSITSCRSTVKFSEHPAVLCLANCMRTVARQSVPASAGSDRWAFPEDFGFPESSNRPLTGLPQVISLVASDTYIIPAFMDYLALDGMGQTLNSVKALKDFPSITQPTLLGVLPTNFSEARRGDHEMYQAVATTLGAKLILPFIRTDARAAYAASHQMAIWEFALKGKA